MKIQLYGEWEDFLPATGDLFRSGFCIGWEPNLSASRSSNEACGVALATREPISLISFMPFSTPWILWNRSDDDDLSVSAYRLGAQAVLPRNTPLAVVSQTLARFTQPVPEKAEQMRAYQRGEPLFVESETVLFIESGVISTSVIHRDGAEVLLGMSGPGQILVAHPPDACFIQLNAHSDCRVRLIDWNLALRRPEFPALFRSRLRQMEAWSAMQARPYLDQRLYGILGLLADQFGQACDEGVKIDLRVTHAQLASAIGATRTTVTRLLGEMRATGKLSMRTEAGGEFFCLPQPTEFRHH